MLSTNNRVLNIVGQLLLITAVLSSAFTPITSAQAYSPSDETVNNASSANDDLATSITLGETSPFVSAPVKLLSEEIAKQPQNQNEDRLQIKLSAEPAIYLAGKPITTSWKITGGNASKTSGLQIIVHPSDGVVPTNSKVIPETDGSVIISPSVDSGTIAWKVLDYAVFPIALSFDLVVDGEVVDTNLVYVDQPLATTSTSQTARMESTDQGTKNKTQVTVPANAASTAMVMNVRYPSPNALNSSPLSWNPVEIIAVDKISGKSVTKFKNPITIQMNYDEKKLFGANEQDLSIYYYDPELMDWFPMETTVDIANNTLTVKSSHLTVFDYKANNWQSQMLPTVDAFKTSDFTGASTYQINMLPPGFMQPETCP